MWAVPEIETTPESPSAMPPPAPAAAVDPFPYSRARLKLPETTMLVFVLVALSVVFAFRSPYFLTWSNWVNILTAVSVAGIIAAPGTLLLVAAQADLSVGSGALFTGVVMSWFSLHYGISIGVLAAVGGGLVLGLTNGLSVTVLRVNAIITTLGTLAMFRGFGQLISGGESTIVEGFDPLGNARPFLQIPVPVLLFLGLAVGFWFLMRYTVFGRSMYAIGSSPVAARMTGIRARRLILISFILSGLCVALSGMVLVSQLGATTPNSGFGLELFVITAVILGGASLTGGRGTILGTVLGLLILGVVNNGLVLLNVNTYWQDVVRGGLLILAVAFDQLRVNRASR
jgi:ribose transport system permease protein